MFLGHGIGTRGDLFFQFAFRIVYSVDVRSFRGTCPGQLVGASNVVVSNWNGHTSLVHMAHPEVR